MSNTKIHIDQLFAKGLENLEIPVFSSEFENIKGEITPENKVGLSESKTTFESFELPVTNADWLAIKAKLALAVASDPINNAGAAFSDFELEVTDMDWQGVKERLAKSPVRTMPILPTEYVKQSLGDFEIAVTDADWQATKSKLNNANKKKMVWWWWLNIAIIGSLIGFGLNHFASLNQTSATQNPAAELKANVGSFENKTENIALNRAKTENSAETRSIVTEKAESNPSVKPENVNTGTVKENKPQPANISNSSSNAKKTEAHSAPLNKSSVPANNVAENTTPANTPKLIDITKLIEQSPEKANTPVNNINELNATNPAKETNNVDPAEVKTPVAASESTEKPLNNAAAIPVDTTKKPKQADAPTLPPPPVKLPLKFYAGFVTEIARTGRELSSDNQTYTDIRNKSDKPGTQFTFGLAASLQKGKNQFQSGFLVTQQTFVSNYNYVIQIRDSIPLYDPNGKLIGKFPKPGSKLRDTTITGSEHMTIKKVEIPFTYNRFWKLNAKTQLLTGFGGVMSMNMQNKGTKMLNPANNQLYNYNYLKGAEQRFGFSPSLNIGIQREIGKNIVLQTNISGKYSVTNRYDNTFTAKQYSYSKNASSFSAKEYLYSYGLSIKLLYLLH